MSNRFPITVNTSTNRLEELPTSDNINLTGSGIYDGSSIGANGQVLTSTGTGISWEDAPYLTSLGSIDDHSDVAISNPTTGQVLKFDGTSWINGTDDLGTTINTINDIGDVTITSPTTGQVLKFNGTAWVNGTDIEGSGGGATTLNELGDVTISTPSNGQVLKYNGTAWVNGADDVGTSLQPRTTSTQVATSVAAGASANITFSTPKTYALLKIQTSHAAWITLYTDTTSRTNDASRSENTDPTPGSGVIAEIITTGSGTQLITPGTIGFNANANAETYAKIVNKSGSSASITVTLTYVQLEG